jgi:hypothetical protein
MTPVVPSSKLREGKWRKLVVVGDLGRKRDAIGSRIREGLVENAFLRDAGRRESSMPIWEIGNHDMDGSFVGSGLWIAAPVLLWVAVLYVRRHNLSWRTGWFWIVLAAGLIFWSLWTGFWEGVPLAICIGVGAFLAQETTRAKHAELRAQLEQRAELFDNESGFASNRLAIVFAIVFTVILAVPFGYTRLYRNFMECGIVARQLSPDGEYLAVRTNRLCDDYGVDGINREDWSVVYLIDQDERWKPIDFRRHYVSGFSDERFQDIALRWTGDRSLVVEYTDVQPERGRLDSEAEIRDVGVKFVRRSP